MLTRLRIFICLVLVGLLGGSLWEKTGLSATQVAAKLPRPSHSTALVPASTGLWSDIPVKDPALRTVTGKRLIVPQAARLLRVNQQQLRETLQAAPREFTPAAQSGATELTLPLPDGSFERFRIFNSPMLEPELAAKFPDIRTVSGQGIDDPTATLRADWTVLGFHAQVFSEKGVWYIDPYQTNDTETYLSYRRNDLNREAAAFRCQVESQVQRSVGTTPKRVVSGAMLRTYRLAVAATGEYSQVFGGTVPQAMAAIVTTINRVNSIFERDVAVRFNLVANNNLVIYTNPATDPYTNGNANAMIAENQRNVTQVIGAANFDIGHLFGTDGAGLAATPCVCLDSQKAEGITAISNPSGDAFDVDYVAHEIGHQFGAHHSFNSNEAGCSQRSQEDGYEPGSGITIMSYASLCEASNLAINSIPFFHTHSINQMVGTIETTNCGNRTATGNTPPTVQGPGNFTIPQSTPFSLTASASDINGDSLTYSWEQFDLGAAAPPHTDDGTRALFRSYPATTSPTRTFPSLTYILNNANVPPARLAGDMLSGEVLPTTNRTMNFRCTVRDNRTGGGGVNTDANARVTVVAAAGPFQVTAPNTNLTWNGGSTQTVTWNVANTTAAPVSTANVRITLSTDGGTTFPRTLLASTANDGSESVTVPNINTTQARVRVEAVGNIYFDVSDASFTVVSEGGTDDTAAPTVTVTAPAAGQQIESKAGTQVSIVWQSSDNVGVVQHDIRLARIIPNGIPTLEVIATGLAGNVQNFTWNVPENLDIPQAIINVEAADAAGNKGTGNSGMFTVKKPDVAPSDTEKPVVSGVTLSPRKIKRKVDPTLVISWKSTDNIEVKEHEVYFAADGEDFDVLVVAGLPGTAQSFTWTIPNSVPKTTNGVIGILARDAAGNEGTAVSTFLVIK
ncbi:MAG: hypothetical protein K1Y36_10895 [Blastocatellia bacterium]|nr:hypothetical protein [Blastocatellia bacterium]